MLPLVKNSRRNQNSSNWLPSIFEDFFSDDFMGIPMNKQFATPAVNIKETDKMYYIQVAAPGMTKEDFKININEYNELIISLEKKENKEDKNKEEDGKKNTWIRREFSYSSYSQSFVIPENVKTDQITAKMENGVLNILLPKKENQKEAPASKQIEIQ